MLDLYFGVASNFRKRLSVPKSMFPEQKKGGPKCLALTLSFVHVQSQSQGRDSHKVSVLDSHVAVPSSNPVADSLIFLYLGSFLQPNVREC